MKLLIRRPIITIFLAILFALITTVSVMAAVTLLYFRAEGGDQKVILQWDSASEDVTLGYLIYRKTEGGEYSIITPTIDGPIILLRTDSTIPYIVTDTTVTNGVKYWYKLKEIEQGNRIVDPVDNEKTVIPGAPTPTSASQSTQNPTPTSTRTPTKTVSASAKTSKPSKTPVPPTATRSYTIIGQATNPPANPNPTATTISTDNVQAVDTSQSQAELNTATLEPLPSLALVFATTPDQSAQVTMTPTALADPGLQKPSWISKKGLTIVGLLVVIWLALGGWFFFSFRRME
jgi:hypothetical protein